MALFTNKFVALKPFSFPYNNKEASGEVVLCPLINTFKTLLEKAKKEST